MRADDLFDRFRRTGDSTSLAELFDATAPDLHRAAVHLCQSLDDAEDLVQETFLAAIESAGDFRRPGNVRGWLLGILINRARRLRRRRARAEPELPVEPPAEPPDLAGRRELWAQVAEAIDGLPKGYRAPLILHLRYGHRANEIAHALGVPPGTVRSQLSRGMELLRRALPVGVAGAVLSPVACAATVAPRGLAAVRAAVVAKAPGAGVGLALSGALLMKKLALACGVLVLVGFALEPLFGDDMHVDRGLLGASPAGGATAPGPGNTVAATGEVERTEAASPAPSQPAVNARWVQLTVVAATGEPLPGAEVSWFHAEAMARMMADTGLLELQKMLLMRDPRRLAQQYGWTTTADELGRARVTLGRTSHIAGALPGLFGRLELTPTTAQPASGHRLVLVPDKTLRVRVIDQDQRPCVGVPVTMVAIDEHDALRTDFVDHELAVTGEDGIATIVHLQRLREALLAAPGNLDQAPRTFVRPFIPRHHGLGVRIDLVHPPRDPVVLQLPATGTVRARVRLPGVPTLMDHDLVLLAEHRGRFGSYFVGRPGSDGWTRFDHVPTGGRYTVHSLAARDLSCSFDGPVLAGDQVDVVVMMPGTDLTLRARVLDRDGQPVVREHFNFAMEGEGLPAERPFTTDGGGEAFVSVSRDPSAPILELESGVITSIDPARGLGRVRLSNITMRPGVTDLGDLRLERSSLVASGQLIADGQPYVRPIRIGVERFDDGPEESTWRPVPKTEATVDADGHFEVRAELEPATYRLIFDGRYNRPVDPVPFVLGQTGVVVTVSAGQSLAASFLLPEAISAGDIACSLVGKHGRFETAGKRSQAERCRMAWNGLPSGNYELQLSLWAGPGLLASVPDVVIPGAEMDARLVDVDLRDRVQEVVLRLFDAEWQPLDGFGMVFPNQTRQSEVRRGYQVNGPVVRLLWPSRAVSLQLALDGYRPADVVGQGPEFRVQVLPRSRVRVHVHDVPELPKNVRVWMQLESESLQRGRWVARDSAGELAALFGEDSGRWPLSKGRIELLRTDDRQRVRIFLGVRRRQVELRGFAPTRILPGSSSVTVRVPAASWAMALAEYSALGK